MNYEEATKHPMSWIYSHVHEEDRPRLSHEFVPVTSEPASAGGDVFNDYTGIAFRFTTSEGVMHVMVFGYADAMVDAVKDPHGRDYPELMLIDLQKQFGVRILPGEYDPVKEPEITIPVGDPWPEKGSDIYHPVSGLSNVELARDWTDERGRFLLQSARVWTAWYYYYTKVA